MSFKEEMLAELDAELLASKVVWDAIREGEKRLSELKDEAQVHDVTAQRLRMALFSLEGEKDKNFGNANAENSDRLRELLRGES